MRTRIQKIHRNVHSALRDQQGIALVLVVIGLVVGLGAFLATSISRNETKLSRDQVTQNSLRQAKEALLAYAVSWPNIRADTDPNGWRRGPGFLPCPDRTNSGANAGNCGTEVGSAQANRLGRLPFRSLGLPDIRDGSGERLWYAVSSKYKPNDPNYDINPDTGLGTITVRGSDGTVLHDGTNTDLYAAQSGGVVAVVLAPGDPVERWNDAGGASRTIQDRGCGAVGCDSNGTCNAVTAPRCNPINYLEKAWGLGGDEDNADFVDRNDSRVGNANGFINGPIRRMDGSIAVNDQLAYITYDEIMKAIMNRIALEVANCMNLYAIANGGRYPYPAPICRSGNSAAAAGIRWSDREQVLFGRVPDPPFDTTSADSGTAMANTWAMTTPRKCTLDSSDTERWWLGWRSHVFIAVADNYKPGNSTPGACDSSSCLQVVDTSGTVTASNKQYAIIISGKPLANTVPPQTRSGGTLEAPRVATNYLEGTNALLEGMNSLSSIAECSDMSFSAPCSPLSSCNRVTYATTTSIFNDVVYVFPP